MVALRVGALLYPPNTNECAFHQNMQCDDFGYGREWQMLQVTFLEKFAQVQKTLIIQSILDCSMVKIKKFKWKSESVPWII